MKKNHLLLAAGTGLAAPFLALAASDIMPKGATEKELMISMATGKLTDVLGTVANYVIGLLLLVAVFYVLWAAYTFITSSGETEKVNAARSRIMYAGIGVVVALLAKGIVSLVLSAVK